MDIYSQFESNPEFERDGIWYDYGVFRFKARFAGGMNKAYASLVEATMKPYRRLIDQNLFSEDRSKALLMSVYSKTIISDWQTAEKNADGSTKVDEKGESVWIPGIQDRNGNILPVTPESVLEVFKALPNLFLEVVNVATTTANYRLANLEADSKN